MTLPPLGPVTGGLTISAVVITMAFLGIRSWYRNSGPGSAKDCPSCLGVKTYRRTSSQTLAAIGTGQAKGGRQQVIETFACSNCGHSVTRNRLEATQQEGPPPPS